MNIVEETRLIAGWALREIVSLCPSTHQSRTAAYKSLTTGSGGRSLDQPCQSFDHSQLSSISFQRRLSTSSCCPVIDGIGWESIGALCIPPVALCTPVCAATPFEPLDEPSEEEACSKGGVLRLLDGVEVLEACSRADSSSAAMSRLSVPLSSVQKRCTHLCEPAAHRSGSELCHWISPALSAWTLLQYRQVAQRQMVRP